MKNGKDVVKIEKGIPLPEIHWATANPLVLAMKKMKNGDSFLWPLVNRNKLPYCANKAQIVIAVRTVNETTVRCWRIKERPAKSLRS